MDCVFEQFDHDIDELVLDSESLFEGGLLVLSLDDSLHVVGCGCLLGFDLPHPCEFLEYLVCEVDEVVEDVGAVLNEGLLTAFANIDDELLLECVLS